MHSTFILALLFYGGQEFAEAKAAGYSTAMAWHEAWRIVGLICAVFTCVVLHEYGHALTARHFGIGTKEITLFPVGGVAWLDRIPTQPRQEMLVAVAGPAVNLVIVILLLAAMGVSHVIDLGALTQHRGEIMHKLLLWESFGKQLLLANVAMIVFNAIPAFPMDGGRVLRALLATRLPRPRATMIAAGIGKVFALFLFACGLMTHHHLYLLSGIFVWFGASREAEASREEATAYP